MTRNQDRPAPPGLDQCISRMWMFVVLLGLLHRSPAAPVTGEHSGSLQLVLQPQLDQPTPSATTDMNQQTTSSSSSSSDTSESSQSSEGPQQVRERLNLENTAVEQVESFEDGSQEGLEFLQPPSNSSTSLWLNELVLLGERAAERDRERETGDDSTDSGRQRALLMTFHPLLTRPRTETGGPSTQEGGAEGLMGVVTEEGGVKEEKVDAVFPQLVHTEPGDGPTFDYAHYNGYHGNEAAPELGL
ncbi:uncharacterized protein LOC113140686 [Mastacembelus armatus]|uniref:uncharacterized protein LOC113140686 n=1 Tax=Mastacembelus armatus TaxID=205130 RepID=UPI000E457DAB|nr:uncharacterized protein LOC113140686 [Mastacembelus armatus]